jgi:hypothetical protein
MKNLVGAPSCRGVFGDDPKTIDESKALTSVSAGQGFDLVGTAGFEPTTP